MNLCQVQICYFNNQNAPNFLLDFIHVFCPANKKNKWEQKCILIHGDNNLVLSQTGSLLLVAVVTKVLAKKNDQF